MNDEFALDPGIVSRVSELKLLLSKFGFYEGRFISRFPGGWVRLALNGVADQNLRQKVHVLMERNKEAVFIRSNRTYDDKKHWGDNAAEQHAIAPFKRVISVEARPGFIHIDDLDPTSFPASRDARVTGSLENMMNAILPLLKVSGSLYLADPYFHPWKPKTRELLNAVLAERKPGAEFRAFVSSKDWPEGEYADKQIRESLPEAPSRSGRFKVLVCDDERATSRMHARYLFSEKGGVRLDKGLQTDDGVVDLSFVDKSVHEDLMRKFVERPLPYEVVREYHYW